MDGRGGKDYGREGKTEREGKGGMGKEGKGES